jgi:hypothetical protein
MNETWKTALKKHGVAQSDFERWLSDAIKRNKLALKPLDRANHRRMVLEAKYEAACIEFVGTEKFKVVKVRWELKLDSARKACQKAADKVVQVCKAQI